MTPRPVTTAPRPTRRPGRHAEDPEPPRRPRPPCSARSCSPAAAPPTPWSASTRRRPSRPPRPRSTPRARPRWPPGCWPPRTPPSRATPRPPAAARAEVLTGDALRGRRTPRPPAAVPPPPRPPTSPHRAEPTIVAQSQGRQWPRAILASTLDEATNTQWLHVMVSDKPDQPFRIASSVPMFGGAELPALGEQLAGAPLLDAGEKNGLAASPGRRRRGLRGGHRAAQGQGHRRGRRRRPVRDRPEDRSRCPGQGPRQARHPGPGPRPAARGRHHLPPRRRWLGHLRPDGAHRHPRGQAQGQGARAAGGVREAAREEEGRRSRSP